MNDRDALVGMEMFLAVLDAGSLTAAAKRLRVTPSAISKQLGKLETRLRVRLLERTTRSMRATPAGERYALHARRILRDLDLAEADANADDTSLAGLVRVTSSTLFGQEIVAPLAARFVTDNPGVTVEMHLTDRFVDLVSEPFELAVRVITRLPESGLTARRLGSIGWSLVAAPAYVARHGAPERPGDLAGHRCLTRLGGPDETEWTMAFGGREHAVPVSGPLRSSSLLSLLRAAVEGAGIVRAPTYLVRNELREGRLVRLLPDAIIERRRVFAVRPGRTFVASRVRAFIDFLAADLPSLLAETAGAAGRRRAGHRSP